MSKGSGAVWIAALVLGAVLATSASAAAATRCDQLLLRLAHQVTDVDCFESTDFTTNNPATTPADNSLSPPLPVFAFTPQTDRAVISPSPLNRMAITKTVPGVQLDARIADDPAGEDRILIRLPDQWNGKLIVAGASGTRSESAPDPLGDAAGGVFPFRAARQSNPRVNLLANGETDVSAMPKHVHCCRINVMRPIADAAQRAGKRRCDGMIPITGELFTSSHVCRSPPNKHETTCIPGPAMSATALSQIPIRDLGLPRTKTAAVALPPPDTKRWTMRRKAAVVEAVHSGMITIEQVCRRYSLSVEEFLSWHNTIQSHGVAGLQITKLRNYRYARPKRE